MMGGAWATMTVAGALDSLMGLQVALVRNKEELGGWGMDGARWLLTLQGKGSMGSVGGGVVSE